MNPFVDEFPLSWGQRSLWFLQRLAPDSTAWHLVAVGRVLASADPGTLRDAFQALVDRHAALRTTFVAGPDGPVQRVAARVEVAFSVVDGAGADAAELLCRAHEEAFRPFDLECGPLFRATLLRGGAEPLLVLAFHHLIADLGSFAILARELRVLLGEGEAPALPAPGLGFAEWALEEERLLGGRDGERAAAYWQRRLAAVPSLDLPLDRPRPVQQGFRGATRTLRMPAGEVREMAREQGVTLFVALLAGFQSLLSRYSGQEDFLIGSPATGRTERFVEVVGYFANLLPLRADLSGRTGVTALTGARRTLLEALRHRRFPFARLAELEGVREAGRPPLVQAMLAWEQAPEPDLQPLSAFALGQPGARLSLGALELESVLVETPSAQLDLTLMAAELDGELVFSLQFDIDLFDGATAERMLGHLRNLLGALAAEPARPLRDLEMLSPRESRQLLVEWNATAAPWPLEAGLHELFEAQARRTPEAAALLWRGERWTYAELARRAQAVARRLRALGVGPEVRVAVFCARTPDLVATLLGVLSAGGAYVPLDPAYPAQRIARLLADSGAAVALTQEALAGALPSFHGEVVLLETVEEGEAPLALPRGWCHSDQLAYTIYTSGSTGTPNGVGIRHGAAVARVAWAMAAYPADRLAGVLASTSVCFDLSVFELFVPLAAGGSVILAEDALELPRLPDAAAVTLINTVPSAMAELVRAGAVPPSVRGVNLAGEPLRRELVAQILARTAAGEVWNLYGPSEDTTYSTGARFGRGETLAEGSPGIGRPLPNSRAHVLDPDLRPVPVGVPGQLWLGGAGLARGYLDRPALTADRFRPDPFADLAGEPGGRLYRTGDLVRREAGGGLSFLGRIDHQVKVRGFRIELGEVESALLGHPEVGEVVVVARGEGEGARYLAAYVAPAPGTAPDPVALRAYLRERLPDFMVPSAWVLLEALPRTPNGKVDRKALPAPQRPAAAGPAEPPRTPIERAVAALFEELLGVPLHGIHDDFFALGGHSLLGIRLTSRLHGLFGVDLPLSELFRSSTVARLAAAVEALQGGGVLREPPLRPAPRDTGGLPLSFAQERLWFIDRLAPGKSIYNIPIAVRLEGRLDVSRLAGALSAVVDRHEALRTTFDSVDDRPVQVVAPPAPAPRPLPVIDLAALAPHVAQDEAQRWAAAEAARPFDLEQGPLFRVALLRLAGAEHILLLGVHHIVADGGSLGILAREVAALYGVAGTGAPSPLPPLALHYGDYAAWQRAWLRGEALEARLAPWRERLAGAPLFLDLPADRPRPPVQAFAGGMVPVALAAELSGQVRALAAREGGTLFMALLAGFAALLHRVSGAADLVVGSVVADRGRAALEGMFGLFANTLPLRIELGGQPEALAFRDLLARARGTALAAYSCPDVPFDLLVQELHQERDLSRNPLFQVMLVLQDGSALRLRLPDVEATVLPVHSGTAKLDLMLSVAETPRGIEGELEVDSALFDLSTALRLSRQLGVLLSAAVEHPDLPVEELPLLGAAERHQILREWNDHPAAAAPACVPELIEAQVARTPDAVAVSAGSLDLTYRELNERAERLARRLRRLGAGPEVALGILAERSADLIVALLAAFKSGSFYVPLDPSFPAERLSWMLEDTGAPLLLAQPHLAASAPAGGARLVVLEEPGEEAGSERLSRVLPGNLAYTIFTSGSTGRPKGVQISHGALARFVASMLRKPGLSAGDTVLGLSTPSFDISCLEIFVPLTIGARVAVPDRAAATDGSLLGQEARRLGATLLQATPTTWRLLLESGWQGDPDLVGLCGGEVLPRELARALRGRLRTLWNGYGPTEATVYTTMYEVTAGPGPVPIGRGVSVASTRVVDHGFHLVPVGVAGELLVGGAGLARGYARRPDLTAERFVPDPFAETPGGRLYRTGDLVRWLADGHLDFLGRADHQVKVRGFRIELGEIESALQAHPAVSGAVVLARELAGETALVAYLTADPGPLPESEALREHLRARLPQYMLPAAFVALDAMPRTPSGKVDRRALAALEVSAGSAGVPAASKALETPVQEILAGVWSELLAGAAIGPRDSFFALGGHSLLATRVIARVRSLLGVDVPVRVLFENPTLRGFAAVVETALGEAGGEGPPPLRRALRDGGGLPLSFAQERLWFIDRLAPGRAIYNIPVAVRLEGRLGLGELEGALSAVADRHEALRTTFAEVDGRPVQVVAPPAPRPLPVVDLAALAPAAAQAEARRVAAAEAARPFDLERGPLFRVALLRLAAAEHVLVLGVHHIVADGGSLGILAREVAALYGAAGAGAPSPLPPLALHYGDYAAWQREWLTGEALEERLAPWRERLAGAPASLDLPTDRPRPPVQAFAGGMVPVTLAADLSRRVQSLAAQEGVTLFMTLLAAFAALLHRASGASDLVVGSVVADRGRTELEGMFGLFANTLPLRLELGCPPEPLAFRDLLARARATALAAYSCPEVPFDLLVQELHLERDLSRNPLFQVMLVLQDGAALRLRLPDVEATVLPVHSGTAKLDLMLSVAETPRGIEGELEVDTALFDLATALRLSRQLGVLLSAAVEHPDLPVEELPLLGAAERHQILREWNDHPAAAAPVCVPELIEAQVARTPDAVAVSAGSLDLTYRELNERAECLARRLRRLGAGPEVALGVLAERSADLIVALLAAFKSGSFYVPLDPSFPAERLSWMLEDTGAPLLLAQPHLAASAPAGGARLVMLEEPGEEEAGSERLPRVLPGNLAYTIFTSGSTGRPKGVQISHGALARFLASMLRKPGLSAGDTVLGLSTPSFDISCLEIFLPLTIGARVAVPDRAAATDGALLGQEVRRLGATLLQATPTTWRLLLESGWQGDPGLVGLCGGEALPREMAQALLARLRTLWNVYGPTETTVWATVQEVGGEPGPMSVGRGVFYASMHVVDRGFHPVPVGVAGELLIGGSGVARGYAGRPDLTAERFVPDPLAETPGGRMYRTGDLVRWLADGRLDFLGRADHQVKVRGFRIELGEIESALQRHPAVGRAVVLARELTGETALVAYFTAEPGHAGPLPGDEALREHLRSLLPQYMMPAAFVALDVMPRTPTGKVDRRALAALEVSAGSAAMPAASEALETPVQEILAGIWSELLAGAAIGPRDSFFALGGHSLMATRVIARVRSLLGADVPVRALFENPTLRGFAAVVETALGGEAGGEAPPPLRPVPREGTLPLSFSQQRLWFIDQLEPGSPAYNLAAALRLRGRLEVPVLAAALAETVRRHEVLRTTFRAVEGQPVQVIAPEQVPVLPLLDLRGLPAEAREREALRLAREEALRPYDLGRGPVLRSTLLELGPEDHAALVTLHHIAGDGWSLEVLIRDLQTLYAAFLAGRPSPLPELPVQYADFACWQRRWLSGEMLEAELAYWRRQLAGAVTSVDLPFDRPRPAVRGWRGGLRSAGLPAELAAALQGLARSSGATLFMTLLAAWQALLHRYSTQLDLTVGTPIAGRNHLQLEGLIGFFVNTLVLRGDFSGDPTFADLLARVRQTTLGAFAHQSLPFEKLVEDLHPERDTGRNPLFQVVFALQSFPAQPIAIPGLAVQALEVAQSTARFDLQLSAAERDGQMLVSLEYSEDLFDAATVDRMLVHYRTLVEGALAAPGLPLPALPLLDEAESGQVLRWQGRPGAPLAETCLHRLFEERAETAPGAPALVHPEGDLTYGELNARANRLARHLRSLGVGPEVRVALCLERGPQTVVAILAVLKAGGAYVPLDPAYPADWLSFVLTDSRSSVLLAQPSLSGVIEALPALRQEAGAPLVLFLDGEGAGFVAESPENLAGGALPQNLAYIIYTSGSTGRPKGVPIPHSNVLRLFRETEAWFGFGAEDVWTLFHSYAFDFSVWEIWGALLYGGRLVVVPYAVSRSPRDFSQLLRREGVTVLNQTPSAFGQLVRAEEEDGAGETPLRWVIFGGEALDLPSLGPWFARYDSRRPRLVNMYGITETTVHVTYRPIEPRDVPGWPSASPIGVPIPDLSFYLLDRSGQPVPLGVPGEIHVGGDGLARGYLDRPALTAERFVPDPFSPRPGARLYRSGDLARLRPDGQAEYLGRIDHQVKIRGFRIELGEIEAALSRHPAVRAAVALALEGERGDRRLAAYAVVGPERQVTALELREELRQALPPHMVPPVLVLLDELPLTATGKVDRKALAALEGEAVEAGRPGAALETPTEELLAGIWAALLRREPVGADDDFFQLGGHSLLATQVVARIRQTFGVELPLRVLFEQPRLRALARHVDHLLRLDPGLAMPPIAPVAPAHRVEAPLPASPAQQRLWLIDQLEPGSASYNLPASLELRGPLDGPVLAAALREVVRRHETLRTTFVAAAGEPVQVIAPGPPPAVLTFVDLEGLPEASRQPEALRLAGEDARTPFDLATGPLVRTALLRLTAEDHLLVVNLHHIISDGWSTGILVRELAALYEAFQAGRPSPLPELEVQYADFAVWQRQWLASGALAPQLEYWRRQLVGVPVLELPTDRPVPPVRSRPGARHVFTVSPRVRQELEALGRREGATLAMILVAAWQRVLARHAGQDLFAVGMPVAGRSHVEVEPLIGFFVNTLVLRADLGGDPTGRELLQRARETALGAYAHQGVTFERLVEELRPERSFQHSPLFQVLFVFQNAPAATLELADLTITSLPAAPESSRFDLTLAVEPTEADLLCILDYDRELFDATTVQRMGEHLLLSLDAGLEERFSDVVLLTPQERAQAVVEWNDTRRPWDEAPVHEQVARRAAEAPDAVAVVLDEQHLTYSELERRASRLAARLAVEGVAPEVRVGLCMEPSLEMMVGLFAILKAGGVYVPVDPRDPAERLARVLADAGANLVVTQERLGGVLAGISARLIYADTNLGEEAPGAGADGSGAGLPGTAAAYVIYTSGSTGMPKGVVATHAGLANFTQAMADALALGPGDRMLQFAVLSFDASAAQIFPPLVRGATLVLHANPRALSPRELADWCVRTRITVLDLPAALWRQWVAEVAAGMPAPPAIRQYMTGGESIPTAVLYDWANGVQPDRRLLSSYGPTEATVTTAAFQISAGETARLSSPELPIGRTFANVQVYLLDERFALVPYGAPAEVCIGGTGVARGYHGMPDRTAERFVPAPWAEEPGGRLYRTGDRARRLADGRLQFLGRRDHQVKIRGFRVELEEIETALGAYPGVRERAVVLREVSPADRRLVAYLVIEGDLALEALEEALRQSLPAHMVPSLVALAEMPLTPGGKIDRRFLTQQGPLPALAYGAAYQPPRTPLEHELAAIFAGVLGVERVGIEDGFFDLGGHSLLATQLVSRVRQVLGVELPLRALFDRPTVAALAAEIERLGGAAGALPAAAPAQALATSDAFRLARALREVEDRLPLSFAQERLWFLDRLEPGTPTYNISDTVDLHGDLRVEILAAAFDEVVRRHESLRTTFEEVEGIPVQRISAGSRTGLPQVDLSALSEAARLREAERLARELSLWSFDLARGPLFTVALLRLAADWHRVLLVLHHIVTDGWSVGVLVREVGFLYEAGLLGRPSPLPDLAIQYPDFALWQRRFAADTQGDHLAYWTERLGGTISPLELPTDRQRPAVQTYRGGRRTLRIANGLADPLRAFSRSVGATLFMTLLAGVKVLLQRYSGQTDVLVGAPIAGRQWIETEDLIGFFLNTLVLRTDLSGDPEFKALVRRVREVTLAAYSHQDVPFEAVLAALPGERDASRTPLFQVLFNMLSFPPRELALPGLTFEALASPEMPSKFDMTFYVVDSAEGIQIDLAFNVDLFSGERIERLLGQLEFLLAQALEQPQAPVGSLSLVPAPDRALLPDPVEELDAGWMGAVHELFLARAQRSPDAVAVVDPLGFWTYRDLEAATGGLAAWLAAQGVGHGDRVAVYAHRSAPLVQAVLAVLRAGAAFTILDPSYPAARLAEIVRLATPRAVLELAAAGPLPEELAARLAASGCARRLLPEGDAAAALAHLDQDGAGALPRPRVAVGPDDLAFLGFTSGSTGTPKGILGRHGPLSHFLPWQCERFGMTGADRFSLLSGLAHDPLQRDLFTPLSLGATILIPDPADIGIPGRLAAWMAREGVTVSHLTPAMAQLLTEGPEGEPPVEVASLRRVLLVGDVLTRSDCARIRRLAPSVQIVNLYGSTETQRAVAFHEAREVEELNVLPLGRGMKDVQLLVLNAAGGLAGVGELGEIAVRSPHLALGYLDDPALTAEKFRVNPFTGRPEDRIYRTGDLGRYRPDGEVVFAGRADLQVKIRGFRIELGEVEAVLAELPGVREAAAVVREEGGERRLVAFVLPDGGEPLVPSALQQEMGRRVPSYMVPSAIVVLERLPLTPNGKLDRRALLSFELPAERAVAVARTASTPVEELLTGIYSELLGVGHPGVEESFFELGGHSLLVTRLLSRVRSVFGLELPVRTVFDRPTLGGLAEVIQHEMRRTGGTLPPPIMPTPRGEVLPLSLAQQRLWVLDQLAPGTPVYYIAAGVRFLGDLDVPALAAALREVVRRHEALRTSFGIANGEPVQRIAASGPVPLPVVDLSGLPEERLGEASRDAGNSEARRPFDLSLAPLFRALLLASGPREHVLVVSMHHLVSDGWSIAILVRELGALYRAYAAGQPSRLPELAVQYADFAEWQRVWVAGEILDQELAFWRERLHGAPPALELPTDRPRPAVIGYAGARSFVTLPPDLSAALGALSRAEGATLFMTLLAGFLVLLSRYSGQHDILVGTTTAGRDQLQVEDLIGFFVKTLVLRNDTSGEPSFADLVKRTREVALSAYAHHHLPFEKLVEELQPQRDLGRTPFFQVMFVLQNTPVEPLVLPGLSLEVVPLSIGMAKFDLNLAFTETEGGLVGSLEYRRDLFDGTTTARILGQLHELLAAAAAVPERRIADLNLLTPGERQQILEWNATAAELAGERSLPALFEAQSRRRPAEVAVIDSERELTYGEVDRRSNQLARHLMRLGVGPEVQVGVCVERSAEMVVGLLGILKAGGAYVPLDPSYPQERLAFMVEGVPVLLTQQRLVPQLPETGAAVVCLDADRGVVERESAEALPAAARPESLAYIIYTSGSTGRPKGVMIDHRGAVNTILDLNQRFSVGPGDRVLALSSLAFDLSVYDIFGLLGAGGAVVVPPASAQRDPACWADLVARHRVSIWNSVPALMEMFVEYAQAQPGSAPALRLVMMSGDWIPVSLPGRIKAFAPGVEVFSLGGATEASIWSILYPIRHVDPAWTSIPYGRPMLNQSFHILAPNLAPQPIGVPGELFIGGIGVALGYWRDEQRTRERFLVHPESGERLYRTGDRGRYLPDGRIEFLGRLDNQVKIRGFRIELGEIESALTQHPEIAEAAAMVREDRPGEKRLVAYLVATGTGRPAVADVHALVRRRLPEYMVPADYVYLDELPLTSNGKVDRKALPAPSREGAAAFVAAKTPMEELLTEIFSSVLQVERVGVEDSFFDLGGHSLTATQIVSRVREAFGVELPLRVMFEAPTVADLAQSVRETLGQEEGHSMPALARLERTGEPLPLSFAQQRLWFFSQLEPDSPAFNISVAVRLRGGLEAGLLAAAFGELVRRHETLRTTFHWAGQQAVQEVAAPPDSGSFRLACVDLAVLGPGAEAEAKRLSGNHARQPFDLARGPLLRPLLLRLEERDHVVLVTVHHIISDGWSLDVLIRDLMLLYRQAAGEPSALDELPVQYADYAAWQRGWLRDEVVEAQLAYWRERLSGVPDLLSVAVQRPRPERQSLGAGRQTRRIAPAQAEALRALGRREGTTLFMTLLGAFDVLVSYYGGREDILVGSPVAARSHPALEGLIGPFVNLLPLRADVAGDLTVQEHLRRVRRAVLEAHAHQDVPFEVLVDRLRPQREPGYHPLVQVTFTVQAAPSSAAALSGFEVRPVDLDMDTGTIQFDLAANVTEEGDGGLNVSFTYRSDLYDRATADRLLAGFEALVQAFAERPEAQLGELLAMLARFDEEQRAAHQAASRGALQSKLKTLVRRGARLASTEAEPQVVTDPEIFER